MIHNRIEYGLMAAAEAEHLNILCRARVEKRGRTIDAETLPLRNPEHYLYDFNLTDITGVGVAATRGCWTSPQARCTRARRSTTSPAA